MPEIPRPEDHISTLSLEAEARLKAKEWLQIIGEGKDPKETSHDEATPMDLLNRYISHKSLEPTTVKGYLFNFEKYLNKYKDKLVNVFVIFLKSGPGI